MSSLISPPWTFVATGGSLTALTVILAVLGFEQKSWSDNSLTDTYSISISGLSPARESLLVPYAPIISLWWRSLSKTLEQLLQFKGSPWTYV